MDHSCVACTTIKIATIIHLEMQHETKLFTWLLIKITKSYYRIEFASITRKSCQHPCFVTANTTHTGLLSITYFMSASVPGWCQCYT